MTREEAIKICKNIDASAEIRFKHPEVEEAFNMAIEALEQLTSYERTINKLTKAISEQEPIADRIEYGTDGNAYRLTISNGKEFKQEPKTGQWLAVGFDGYADGYPVVDLWECSECHEEHYGEEDTLTMYCPNCGAKMESEG